jgi:AhpD family alkylhydroperoxidase
MSARIDYRKASPEGVQALASVGKYIHEEKFDPILKALVELRVSQINGCAYCLNLHTQEGRAAGETQQRLDCLSAWRETTFYTEKEMAALAWAEALTLVAQGAPSDAVYEEAAKHFSEREMVNLSLIIVGMNAWNRMSVGFHLKVPVRN